MELLFEPYKEVERLETQLREARKTRNTEKINKTKLELVHLYVKYGEFFKMSDRPNPKEAIRLLEKAIQLLPYHPLANYRLAHLYYRAKYYEKAALHFRKAIDHNKDSLLNQSQTHLAQLFLANCGILITKEVVQAIELAEDDLDFENDPLIAKYRDEIIVTSEETIDRLYYRKLSKVREEIITVDVYKRLADENPDDTVLLYVEEDGKHYVKLGANNQEISIQEFQLLYTILMSTTPLTNENISEKLFNYRDNDVSEDSVRRYISRLKGKISFWDEMIEISQFEKKTARSLKQNLKGFVLCRAGDPEELIW